MGLTQLLGPYLSLHFVAQVAQSPKILSQPCLHLSERAAAFTVQCGWWHVFRYAGSSRLDQSNDGHDPKCCRSFDFLPFGEQISGGSTTNQKFAQLYRDSESGLDYANARFYTSGQGRFMSPDPSGNVIADASTPQTWNMYSYALNNPLKFVDPSGTAIT